MFYRVSKMAKDLNKTKNDAELVCETKEDIDRYLASESAVPSNVSGLYENSTHYYTYFACDGEDENGNPN